MRWPDGKTVTLSYQGDPIPKSQVSERNLGTYRGIEWCKDIEIEAVFADFLGAHVLWQWKATGLQLEEGRRTEGIPVWVTGHERFEE